VVSVEKQDLEYWFS